MVDEKEKERGRRMYQKREKDSLIWDKGKEGGGGVEEHEKESGRRGVLEEGKG